MPSYGGQWKDPKTGKFDQKGYDKYLRDINQKYLERLAAAGQLKEDNKYAKEYGVDVKGTRAAALAQGAAPSALDALLDLNRNLPLAPTVGMGDLRALEQRQATTPTGMGALRAFEATQPQTMSAATLAALAAMNLNRGRTAGQQGTLTTRTARFDTDGLARLSTTASVSTRPLAARDLLYWQEPGWLASGGMTGDVQHARDAARRATAKSERMGVLPAPIPMGQNQTLERINAAPGPRQTWLQAAGKSAEVLLGIGRIQSTENKEAARIFMELNPNWNPRQAPPVGELNRIKDDPRYAERLRMAALPVAQRYTQQEPVFDTRVTGGGANMQVPEGYDYGFAPPTLAEKRYVDEVLLDGRPTAKDQKPRGQGVISQALATGDRSAMPPIIFGNTAYTLFNSAQQMKLAEQYGLQWGSVESMMESLEYEFDPLIRPLGGWLKRVPAKPAVQYPFQQPRRRGGGGGGGYGGGGGGYDESKLFNWNVRIT